MEKEINQVNEENIRYGRTLSMLFMSKHFFLSSRELERK
jgi:hypothetical protein